MEQIREGVDMLQQRHPDVERRRDLEARHSLVSTKKSVLAETKSSVRFLGEMKSPSARWSWPYRADTASLRSPRSKSRL
jgi:sigma54-dependent transcription regulator